jgi:hypothetical protein
MSSTGQPPPPSSSAAAASAYALLPPALPAGFERWLYTPEELAAPSLSQRDGFTPGEEAAAHRDALDYINSFMPSFSNANLGLAEPRRLLGTAHLIYHRFYARRSLKGHDRLEVATAAVMLSAKVVNRPQYIKFFVGALLARRDRRVADEHSEAFVLAKEALVSAERSVLGALEFDMASLVLPYDYVRFYVAALGLDDEWEKLAMKGATSMLSQRRVLLGFDPRALAHTALYMAVRLRKANLPPSTLVPLPRAALGGTVLATAGLAYDPPLPSTASSGGADESEPPVSIPTDELLFTPMPVMQAIMGALNPAIAARNAAAAAAAGAPPPPSSTGAAASTALEPVGGGAGSGMSAAAAAGLMPPPPPVVLPQPPLQPQQQYAVPFTVTAAAVAAAPPPSAAAVVVGGGAVTTDGSLAAPPPPGGGGSPVA